MQRIGFVVSPGFQVMGLAALSVFEFANLELDQPRYEAHILSETGGRIVSSIGMSVDSEPFGDPRFDTLMVVGETGIAEVSPETVAFVRQAQAASRRIAASCTGAFILAQAGVLDGRRATTHWIYARDLRTLYPAIKVEEDRIFIADGQVWTSAGMTAGVDLALALVEEDLGAEVARQVARKLVVYHRRAGGQSQHSTLLELQPKSDRIQDALDFARNNLSTDLSVEQLAAAARLSPRQFSRAFRSETGQSPAKAIEQLRVETARMMMETSRHPVEIVAYETGFADRERMRRAFVRAFGQPPQTIRRNARVEGTMPA